MTRRPVSLQKPPNETVTATFCPLTLAHVEQIDTFWRAILRAAQEPDIGWDWAYKLRLAVNDRRYEAYAIEWEDLVQGVMLLETQWHRSWLSARSPLVYVEYLASAPWNRRPIEDPPYLAGVGRSLTPQGLVMPVVPKYHQFPWAAVAGQRVLHQLEMVFDHRYFMASSELNLLNTILLEDEVNSTSTESLNDRVRAMKLYN